MRKDRGIQPQVATTKHLFGWYRQTRVTGEVIVENWSCKDRSIETGSLPEDVFLDYG